MFYEQKLPFVGHRSTKGCGVSQFLTLMMGFCYRSPCRADFSVVRNMNILAS